MCYKAVKPSIIHCTILRACCRSCAPDWNASTGRFPDDKAGVPEQINYLRYPVGWCDQIAASSTDSRNAVRNERPEWRSFANVSNSCMDQVLVFVTISHYNELLPDPLLIINKS